MIKKFILIFVINLLAKTWSYDYNFKPNKGSIIGFWHGLMLPVWYKFRKQNPIAVVSKSKDGEYLSSLLKFWNYRLIRGSSSSGGKEVLNEMIDNIKGNIILITPDGPRGPKNELKPGLLLVSQRSESDFYFLKVEISKKYIFQKSWDYFSIPYPFAKIKITALGPYQINKNTDKNDFQTELEKFNKLFNC